MSKLITNNLKLFNVDNFIESFSEPNYNLYYYFLAKPTPYPVDGTPPTLTDNAQSVQIDPYDNMICGKRITSSDVAQMVPRKNWTAGRVYTPYSHDLVDIYETDFYVVAPESGSYHVFKCVDNNRGSNSTVSPLLSQTSADDDSYFTADGYQWKYMYSITSNQFAKFATNDYIPVYVNANVVGNAVSGSIQSILVANVGSGYASYCNGFFQEVRVGGNPLIYQIDSATASANANFYINSAIKITAGPGSGQQKVITGYTVAGSVKRVIIDSQFSTAVTTSSKYEITPLVQIIGDGTGAQARAIVNASSNTIQSIEVVSRGQGYTYANAVITGNTGVINVSTGTAITATSATGKIIISPKGGHGSNAAAELGARYVGMSTEFDSTLSGGKVVDSNDFRIVGVIKDPLFANVVLSISGGTGTFVDAEVVKQSQANGTFTAYGVVTFANSSVVRLSNAYGIFLTGNSTVNILTGNTSGYTAVCDTATQPSTYFDQTYKLVGTMSYSEFQEDELITQSSTTGNGFFYSQSGTGGNARTVRLVNKRGTFNQSDITTTYSITGSSSLATMDVSALADADLVHGTGDVIYVENFAPVQKTAGQTETIKLILKF